MYRIKSMLPQRSPCVTHWDITQGSSPDTRHGDSPLHFLFAQMPEGITYALLHHWALLGTVPLMWTGDCSEGERGPISSYCSLSEQREQQRDSAHSFWCLHLTEPGQKLTMSVSIQKHELQFIIKSATAGQWMCGAPKHCLIYICAAQNLDTERGLWNVSKMIVEFFLLRLLNLSWLPKNIWETEINRISYNPQTWKKVHKFASYWAKNPETQKLCLLQQIYPLLIKQLQLVTELSLTSSVSKGKLSFHIIFWILLNSTAGKCVSS